MKVHRERERKKRNEMMEKEASSRLGDSCGELLCVARLEINRPKPMGFLCSSILIPTDNSFHAFTSALLPSTQRVSARRFRMLPTEMDLNLLPVVPNLPDKFLPIGTLLSTTDGGIIMEWLLVLEVQGKNSPYMWEDAAYLTQSSLRVPLDAWESIDESTKEGLVERRLWIKSNMENYLSELQKESKRQR